jgi:hypothetical protein
MATEIQAMEQIMHGTVTRFPSRLATRSLVSVSSGQQTAAPRWYFSRGSLQRIGRVAAGALMVIVFCMSVFVFFDGSNPGFQIISSDIPSAADVGDWLMWR